MKRKTRIKHLQKAIDNIRDPYVETALEIIVEILKELPPE